MTTRSARGAAAALLLLLPLAASAEVSFVPATPDGGSPRVYLEADPAAPNNELRLHVKVEGVEDLFGASFQLRYPDRILRFEEEETVEGDLLALGPPAEEEPPADGEGDGEGEGEGDGEGEGEGEMDEETGPADTVLVVRRRAPKRILVGVSRLGEHPGVSGSGTLVTLVFRARADAKGRGKFRWEENDLVAANGWAIPEVEWVKGTAVVDTKQPQLPPLP